MSVTNFPCLLVGTFNFLHLETFFLFYHLKNPRHRRKACNIFHDSEVQTGAIYYCTIFFFFSFALILTELQWRQFLIETRGSVANACSHNVDRDARSIQGTGQEGARVIKSVHL